MLREFIKKYYLDSIEYETGYNTVNTLTWAIIFSLSIWLLYEKYFKEKDIIDRNFMKSVAGWILLTASVRILRDLNIITSNLFVTPPIFFVMFAAAFSTLIISLRIKKKRNIPITKTWGALAYILSAITLTIVITTPISLNWTGFIADYAVWTGWLLLFLAMKRLTPKAKKFLTNWNLAAIMTHILDASGTFVSMTWYGFSEKHVLGRAAINYLEENSILLINGSGSWAMFALKLAVVPFVLYAIDKYSETENEKKFLKMIIILLGLAIGIRNSLLILVSG